MNTNELNRLLIKLGACSDAVEWAKPYGLQEAWERCKRPEWMLWLVDRMSERAGWPSRKEGVLAACACARTTLKYVAVGEKRPLLAIEAAGR